MTRLLVLLLTGCAMMVGQQQSASQALRAPGATLVLKTELDGTVEVDGKNPTRTNVNRILELKLLPGQHFITLKDLNGVRQAEKIVSVTAGAIVAETLGIVEPAPSYPDPYDKAELLYGMGRMQEALDIFLTLGDKNGIESSRQGLELYQKEFDVRGKAFDSANLLYGQGKHREALRQIGISIQETSAEDKRLGKNSAVDLSIMYDIKGRIEFALGDYSASFQDERAAEDRLTEALSRDQDDIKKSKDHAETSDSHLAGIIMMYLLRGERRAGCTLFDEKEGNLRLPTSVSFSLCRKSQIQPQMQGDRRSLGSEIDDVLRNGRYSPLPPSQMVTGGAGSGPSRVSIVNRTRYSLTVIFSGPIENSVTVLPGRTKQVDLQPGEYRVLGRVDGQSVLPFFGKDQYSAGASYDSVFSIDAQLR